MGKVDDEREDGPSEARIKEGRTDGECLGGAIVVFFAVVGALAQEVDDWETVFWGENEGFTVEERVQVLSQAEAVGKVAGHVVV